jgi:hypothetical protein
VLSSNFNLLETDKPMNVSSRRAVWLATYLLGKNDRRQLMSKNEKKALSLTPTGALIIKPVKKSKALAICKLLKLYFSKIRILNVI